MAAAPWLLPAQRNGHSESRCHRTGTGTCRWQTRLADLLPREIRHPERELIVISACFVPTRTGCAELAELARRGIAVRVLTNSYGATDVGVVHAGYAPYLQRLLEAGVELLEMPAIDDEPKTARKFIHSGSARSRSVLAGRSLHSKAVIVDRERAYIGSANFDRDRRI